MLYKILFSISYWIFILGILIQSCSTTYEFMIYGAIALFTYTMMCVFASDFD